MYMNKQINMSISTNLNPVSERPALTIIKGSRQFIKLLVSTLDSTHVIDVHDILFIKAESSYSYIHLCEGKTIFSSKPMAYYWTKLIATNLFVRIHQSYTVNIEQIEEWHAEKGVILKHSSINLPVARRRSKELKNLLEQKCL